MRRPAILGSIVAAVILALVLAAPVAASSTTYTAKMTGPGPTGAITVTIAGSSGTLHWDLAKIAKDSTLTVTVRGGTCTAQGGLVVTSRWAAHFAGGTSVQSRTLSSTWVGYFDRNWSSRGGDVAIVTNAGHTECKAFTHS